MIYFPFLLFVISNNKKTFSQNSSVLFLSFLFYLKNYKLTKLFKNFENQIMLPLKYLAGIKFFRLLLLFKIIVHHVACLWIFIVKYDLNNSALTDQYLTALYFSLTTMTTVGYGDISPKNNQEKILNILMMVLACAAFGYIINKIQNIFDELNEQKIEYRRELVIMNRYMAKLNINQDTRMRVRNYLKVFWKSNIIKQFDKAAEVLDKLS